MNKTERLSIKVLPSDKALLLQIAQAEGESVAVIIRRLIRSAARRAQVSNLPRPEVSNLPLPPPTSQMNPNHTAEVENGGSATGNS